MGFIGASPQILVFVAIVGFAAAAWSVLTIAVFIFLPHATKVSNAVVFGLRRLSWPRHVPGGRNPKVRIYLWNMTTFALPCFFGMLFAVYLPGRYAYLWSFALGVSPSIVLWVVLYRSGLLRGTKSFRVLPALVIIALSTVAVAFLMYLHIEQHLRYVYFPPGKRMAHLWQLTVYHGTLILLMAVLSLFWAWMFAPMKGAEKMLRVKLIGGSLLVVTASFLDITPFFVVNDAFSLFANGGEHRIYHSLGKKRLEIPEFACGDPACTTSKEIRVAADLGNSLYVWLDVPLPGGTYHTSRLQKIEITGATYEVTKTDSLNLSNLGYL